MHSIIQVLTGLKLPERVNKFSPQTKVVFVPAVKDCALEALQEDAFDIISKPLAKEKLRRVVYKIITTLSTEKMEPETKGVHRVLLKTTKGHHYIDNVLFLAASSNYIKLILMNFYKRYLNVSDHAEAFKLGISVKLKDLKT